MNGYYREKLHVNTMGVKGLKVGPSALSALSNAHVTDKKVSVYLRLIK